MIHSNLKHYAHSYTLLNNIFIYLGVSLTKSCILPSSSWRPFAPSDSYPFGPLRIALPFVPLVIA